MVSKKRIQNKSIDRTAIAKTEPHMYYFCVTQLKTKLK